jgi:hypothetical protein
MTTTRPDFELTVVAGTAVRLFSASAYINENGSQAATSAATAMLSTVR